MSTDHPTVAMTANALGVLFYRSGKMAQAETYFSASADIIRQRLGPAHPWAVGIAHSLATIARDRGEPQRCLDLLATPLEHLRRLPGRRGDLPFTLRNLARCAELVGNRTQACAWYGEAIEILETEVGPEHERTTLMRGRLAALGPPC